VLLSPVDDVEEMRALLRYVAQEQPTIVDDVADVQETDIVLLVGSGADAEAAEQLLRARGAMAHQFSADLSFLEALGDTT
jgi:hypothetical protein